MDVEQLNAFFEPLTGEEAAMLEDATKRNGNDTRRTIKEAKKVLNAKGKSMPFSKYRELAVREAMEKLREVMAEGTLQDGKTAAKALLAHEQKLMAVEHKQSDNSWMFDGRKRP